MTNFDPPTEAIIAKGNFQEEPLSFELEHSGQDGVKLADIGVPEVSLEQALGKDALREDALEALPQLSEFEVIRHFTRLSKMNFAIDLGMYPLGSCTMKYNPRINETVVRFPGLAGVHPMLPDHLVQGTLAAFYHLEQLLLEITGFDALSMQPAAGAQGELTGMMLIRRYMEDKGENRRYILVPDSAHGTNPASAVIAGYMVKELKSTEQGVVDLEVLKAAMTDDVAGLMLTNPNTLGVFEPQITEIAEIVHSKGGMIYCDGANMNAQVGVCRPGEYGMDVMHLNLHKTFSTPHGGGGPGAGPCLCTKTLAPYLPVPRVAHNSEKGYFWDWNHPKSMGKISTFYGNSGILIRALSYILALGGDGLTDMSRVAVLNANYLRHHLKDLLHVSTTLPTLHEVVFSDKGLSQHGGISAMDLAKRLLDYGFHSPTTYFPLTVSGALMMEPTESEPRRELDRFIAVVHKIFQEANSDPELVKNAPHLTPRRRMNEAEAARNPVLSWKPASKQTMAAD